ncbi:hypothetical protein AVEN_260085-1 [Araneus ventricosus]|uniref:Uncharacterized protein n=1 Tax=Araneus ventricosus TaxID=182803 RepID=A0A4Y2G5A9_ARAVE|nr:hypothetical protein AVEN_260085-1 [Araneus ventricosus]
MDLSYGFMPDDYTRVSVDDKNHSTYSDELIKILSPKTFCHADIQISIAPQETKNITCERILYLDKLRKAANSKLLLYERLNNSGVLSSRSNLYEFLDRNHIFADLEHVIRKAQGELTSISACPITNCNKHSIKFLLPTTVLVKNIPLPKPPKIRLRNLNEEFEIVQKK